MAMAWPWHGMAMAWPWHGHGHGMAMAIAKPRYRGVFGHISICLGQRLRRTAGNRGAQWIRGAPDPETPTYIKKIPKKLPINRPSGQYVIDKQFID
jgi:hypothetical protein